MKIALLTSVFERGGASRAMVNMANYWADQGHQVSLFSFEDGTVPSYYSIDERICMEYLSLNKISSNLFASLKNNWQRFVRIRKAIKGVSPDVVISFIDTANVRVILAMIGSGVPVIVSERINPTYEKIGLLWEFLRRWTYPLAKCVVVQTKQAGDFFSDWNMQNVRVIPNPVMQTEIQGVAPDISRPALVAVGRLYEQKAYALLLKAFSRVAFEYPQWTLNIAGDGPLKSDLETLAVSLGLEKRVNFLGQVKDIGGLFAKADGYVMSSAYEGFPNALCEAMAAGLPCVSTNCPSGPADIIIHGQDGLLVANGDEEALAGGLARLMSDEQLREKIGENARSVIDTFSVERVMGLWDVCIFDSIDSLKKDKGYERL